MCGIIGICNLTEGRLIDAELLNWYTICLWRTSLAVQSQTSVR